MKKCCLFLIILLTICCDKPDQFTSVEGHVTDYISKEPVAGIPLEITELMPWDPTKTPQGSDTVISDANGYYCYEFYNKKDRDYEIGTLPMKKYWYSDPRQISLGRANSFNFELKPYR
jgi:hypothetical protein